MHVRPIISCTGKAGSIFMPKTSSTTTTRYICQSICLNERKWNRGFYIPLNHLSTTDYKVTLDSRCLAHYWADERTNVRTHACSKRIVRLQENEGKLGERKFNTKKYYLTSSSYSWWLSLWFISSHISYAYLSNCRACIFHPIFRLSFVRQNLLRNWDVF